VGPQAASYSDSGRAVNQNVTFVNPVAKSATDDARTSSQLLLASMLGR
jgi:hypothetical protein